MNELLKDLLTLFSEEDLIRFVRRAENRKKPMLAEYLREEQKRADRLSREQPMQGKIFLP